MAARDHNEVSIAASGGRDYVTISGTQQLTLNTVDLTADVSGLLPTGNIADDAVTYAKVQNVVANNVILGNNAGAGSIVDELTATEVRAIINVEDGADVTDTANVTAAGALMDSEVDADIKTLSLPASTTISTFGASLVDDLDAAAAQTTLGVDAAGTDNSTDVTKAGTGTYVSLDTGTQVLTVDPIDPADLSAGGTASISTYLRGDNTWATVSGSGDVVKIGTPVDNEIGVWTGDGTLEGDTNFTWDGSILDITGEAIISKTATQADEHGVEINYNAAGFGDAKALDIVYTTGAIVTGQDEASILVNIDETAATGGSVFGLEVLTTDGAADKVCGMKVGAIVAPICQESGTFANPTTGTNNTASTDVAAMIDGSDGDKH